MKAFVKEWGPVAAMLLVLASTLAGAAWQAYRRYQVEQAIIRLSQQPRP